MFGELLIRSIGSLLLVAAALKIHGFAAHAVHPLGLFAAPWFQVTLIYTQIILGIWFLVQGEPIIKWFVAGSVFLVFAGANLTQGILGQSSCGCFGAIPASPWLVLFLDIAILLILVWKPPVLVREAWFPEFLVAIKAFTVVSSTTVIAMAAIIGWFGSLDNTIASIRGDVCSLSPHVLDFGIGEPGEIKELQFIATNRSLDPMRIVGGNSNCAFLSIVDLPILIDPGDCRPIRITIRFPRLPGQITQRGKLFVGNTDLSVVQFQITGKTVGLADGVE